MENYLPIIGMEIHVELKTASKMFCGCKNDPFHAPEPNIYTCPVCLGLPGALPVPNKKAIEWTVRLGLALGCEIPLFAKFDRKHYFYPDLPKGYQISQYDEPFCISGRLVIANEVKQSQIKGIASSQAPRNDSKTIRIRRVHLEEDTGKLIHATVEGKQVSLIDFNRSGVALVEIVTEPDIHSSEEAKLFLQKLQQIIRYLDISDCDMEKGSMRLEPNISLRKVGSTGLPNYKVEVKNINSFRFVGRAIEYEIKRQEEILDRGEKPEQETRGFNESKNSTVSQRSKEEAHDYRYFPEPDIPPIRWTEFQIRQLADQISELPDDKLKRFITHYQLPQQDAVRLTESRRLADYYEEAVKVAGKINSSLTTKALANFLINKKIDIELILPASLIKQIQEEQNRQVLDDNVLKGAIAKAISDNPQPVSDYKNGKEQAIMFLVGQVMRETKGKGNAHIIKEMLQKKLN